ncbi:MAG: DUF6398 domain-containing protein [Deltaproteobacteria bacterium]|jgi:hypothetical protein|nr:DUF6398 domain-containing protein [Deltaproteobacteria bacterium]
MFLPNEERLLYFKIWYDLLWWVNEKHELIPIFPKPVVGQQWPVAITDVLKIREALWNNPHWIDQYLQADHDPAKSQEEIDILTGWRQHFVKDDFFVVKQLAKYAAVIEGESPGRLFGVTGLSDSLEDMIPFSLPFMVKMVLLPFKDKIIYDGLFEVLPVSFGRGIRSSLNKQYQSLKKTSGLIEGLFDGQLGPSKKEKKAKKEKSTLGEPVDQRPSRAQPRPVSPSQVLIGQEKVPAPLADRYNQIADYVCQFCQAKSNEVFQTVCLSALGKLARKRPSPLERGYAENWAAGICYALGSINFIFDRSSIELPYVSANDFSRFFDLSKSSVSSKAQEVKKLLKLTHFSSEFLTNPTRFYSFC